MIGLQQVRSCADGQETATGLFRFVMGKAAQLVECAFRSQTAGLRSRDGAILLRLSHEGTRFPRLILSTLLL